MLIISLLLFGYITGVFAAFGLICQWNKVQSRFYDKLPPAFALLSALTCLVMLVMHFLHFINNSKFAEKLKKLANYE